MQTEIRSIILPVLLLMVSCAAPAQTWSIQGQASPWLKFDPEVTLISQAGFRYIPVLSFRHGFSDDLAADLEFSLNAFASADFGSNRSSKSEGRIKPYRGWLRLSSDAWEARLGMQKINFGSATLFRPLMWFDRIDPRDPLQLTDGVYALLLRYYFLSNTNLWLWGLYGNDETKGWEIAPTRMNSLEYGGRIQVPLFTGEIALSYHHRDANLAGIPNPWGLGQHSIAAEDRIGVDGKWDAEIGLWFEAALVHLKADIPGLEYQRLWTVGADYTFGLGNGLNVLTEHFRTERPDTPFASAAGGSLSALSLSYPLGLVDRLSVILYRDWTWEEWYRIATWQRTYDNWIIYLLGFWNPGLLQLYGGQTGSASFAGTGIQLMVVFNH